MAHLCTGDHNYKRNKKLPLEEQMISALPDIQQETLNPNDEFIIVACDGIWNSLTSQQSVDFVKERIDRGDKISQICEDVSGCCLSLAFSVAFYCGSGL